MFLFCDWLLFEARYSNDDYLLISNRIKSKIEEFQAHLRRRAAAAAAGKSANSKSNTGESGDLEQDCRLVGWLLRAYEVLDGSARIRADLVKFRRELEFFKSKTGVCASCL